MSKTLHYRSGSLIYVQGDEANKVFLLKSGTVNLSYQDIETDKNLQDVVQPGEFFGVRSVLGRYPREENAIALQDISLMVFTVPEFEALIMTNARITMKILRLFSNQLRRIHNQMSRMMETKEPRNPELRLFALGEYYYKNEYFSRAKYVFERYLNYYPSGRCAVMAVEYLRDIGSSQDKSEEAKAVEEFTPAGDPPDSSSGNVAEAYNRALDLVAQGQYPQAYDAFKNILQEDEDQEYTAKSSFELGRCLFLQNQYEDCIKYYTMMIIKYPQHPNLAETLFLMGQSREKNGRKDQALVFYKKILSMLEDVKEEIRLKTQEALKGLEA
jgi:TolA-binding protein